jgi:hypothetical protein
MYARPSSLSGKMVDAFFYLGEFSRPGKNMLLLVCRFSCSYAHLLYDVAQKGGNSPPLATSQQEHSRVIAVINANAVSMSVVRYHRDRSNRRQQPNKSRA